MPLINADTDSMPKTWSYTVTLPSKLVTTTTLGEEVLSTEETTLTWKVRYGEDPDGSSEVEGFLTSALTVNESGTEASVTYTALQVWNATVTWLDYSVSDEARPETGAVKSVYSVYRYVLGDKNGTLEGPLDTVTLSAVENGTDWTLSLENAPGWNEEGDAYVYYAVQKEELSRDPERLGEYSAVFNNVENYSTEEDELFINGTAVNLIENLTTFTVYKEWEDDDATDRPTTGLVYLYRIIDRENVDVAAAVAEANPVKGYDSEAVPTGYSAGEVLTNIQNGDGETIEVYTIVFGESADGAAKLPMYDNTGHKYIYFGLETGIGGNYIRVVNNATSEEKETIVEAFDHIRTENGQVKYVLNKGILTNDREGAIAIPAGKLFVGQSMQSAEDIAVKFYLQVGTYDENGAVTWRDAEESDVVSIGAGASIEDGRVLQTIEGFASEAMGQTASDVTVYKYDPETGEVLAYRWIECMMKVGTNGEWTQVTPVQNEDGSVSYELVDLGEVAPGVGDEMTTAIYQPSTQDNHNIINTLIGERAVRITKKWINAEGNDITADAEEMEGVYVLFTITCDQNAKTSDAGDGAANKLKDLEGNEVSNVFLTINSLTEDGSVWEQVISQLPRYDAEGHEYTYTVTEKEVVDPHGRRWHTDYDMEVVVSQNAAEDYIVEDDWRYVNTQGENGEVFEFEIRKEWLDDSDLLTRAEVTAVILAKNEDGSFSEAGRVVLNEANKWFERIYVPRRSDEDEIDQYLVLEKAVADVEASYDRSYDELREIIQNDLNRPVIGSVVEAKNGASLDYMYEVMIRREAQTGPTKSTYVITNRRYGNASLYLKKTWKAGSEVFDAVFELYRNDKLVDLNADETVEVLNAEIQKDGSFVLCAEDVQGSTASISILNLPKYDDQGVLYDYTVVERGMRKDGQEIRFKNRKASVDGDTYVSSLSRNEEKTKIRGAEYDHTGDEYYWEGTNSREETYTLTAYKVWRDDGTVTYETTDSGVVAVKTVRPDVAFNVYRVSLKNHEELAELIAAGDASALAAALSKYATASNLMKGDLFWNTKHNEWFWSAEIGSVQRYDSEGYAYIYFLQEVYTGSAGIYSKAYSNLTCNVTGYQPVEKPAEGEFTTKEVFGVPSGELDQTVVILSDGVHEKDGDYGEYYSKTTVNTRSATRTISGRKLWKVPEGWTLSASEMPEVKIGVYAFTTAIRDESGKKLSEITEAQLLEKIAAEGATELNRAVLNGGNYSFRFTTDTNGTALQKYDEFGRTLFYYVSEEARIEGYPTVLISISANSFTISNVFSDDDGTRAKITITKDWTNSVTDRAANAPAEFKLYAIQKDSQGKPVGEKRLMATVTVVPDASGSMTLDFGSQPYYGTNHLPLFYWIEETAVDGYTIKAEGAGAYVGAKDPKSAEFSSLIFKENGRDPQTGVTVYTADAGYTNDYVGGSLELGFTKSWADSNSKMNNEAYRVSSLQFELWRKWSTKTVNGVSQPGGDEKYTDVVLTKENGWKYTESGAKKYAENGSAYTYYIKAETECVTDPDEGNKLAAYTVSKSGNTAKNTLSTVTATAKKTWKNSDHTTMDWATFSRLRTLGALPKTVALVLQRTTDGTNWEYVPTGTNSGILLSGQTVRVAGISYTIDKLTSANYNSMSTTWDLLPKYALGTLDAYSYRTIEIITWRDNSVSIYYADDDENNDTLQAANAQFAPEIASAMTSVSGKKTTTTITNTVPDVKLCLTKLWIDNGNREDTRPASVTLHLTLKSDSSKSITFTVNKPAQAGEKNSDGTVSDGNTNSTGAVYIPITGDMAKATGADEIAALLNDAYTVTEDEVPAYKTNTGAEVRYTSMVEGFAAGESLNGVYGVRVVNVGSDEMINLRQTLALEASKTFAGDSAWEAITRPTVRYTLCYRGHNGDPDSAEWTRISADEADRDSESYYTNFFTTAGETPVKTVSIGADGTGSADWGDLKVYFDRSTQTAGAAQKIVYGVIEEMIDADGNVLAASSYLASSTEAVGESGGFSFVNTLQTKELTITKSWQTDDGETIDADTVNKLVDAGMLPETITFELYYRTGDEAYDTTGKTQTVAVKTLAAGSVKWTGGVPAYDSDGNEITWQIRERSWKYNYSEDETDADSDSAITPDAQDAVVSDGSYKVSLVNTVQAFTLKLEKVWDDDDNRDGIRPSSLTVTLKAHPEAETEGTEDIVMETKTVRASQDGTWTVVFEDLPVLFKGGTVTYYAEEESVSDYAPDTEASVTSVSSADAAGIGAGLLLKNVHEPEMVDIEGLKIWEDAKNQDGRRPDSITIRLYANGVEVDSKTVTAKNKWQWSFTGKLKYEKGSPITYTITEDVVEYYSSEVKGYNVVNSYEPEKTSVSVIKHWEDGEDQDGIRPASIIVSLLADGEETGLSAELKEENRWTASFTMLDKYSDGQLIDYTVEESETAGYEAEITGDAETGYVITNTHKPEEVEVTVDKNWDDLDNNDAVRPESITIRLYADNVEIDLAEVTAEDEWSVSFTELPKYRDGGVEIDYTITEDAVDKYSSETEQTGEHSFTVTNSYAPERVSVSVTKVWADEDNNDGFRTESVTVHLYGDGTEIASSELSEENEWTCTFDELLKYHDGQEIVYTVGEDAVEGYEAEVTADADDRLILTITNIHVPETVGISVKKVWDDGDDRDALRPESITVKLLADGIEIDEASVTEKEHWSFSFTSLPKYADGIEIEYTIEEAAVESYETEITGDPVTGFTVTNIHVPAPRGNLTISKTVAGTNGDLDMLFAFTVEFDAEGSYLYEGSKSGTIESGDVIYLKHGESVTILDLPAGTAYTVTESANTGYRISSEGAEGRIEDLKTAEAAFTNTARQRLPITGGDVEILGITFSLLQWMLLLVLALSVTAALLAVLAVRRKKEEG